MPGLPGASCCCEFPHADISITITVHTVITAPLCVINYTLTVINAGPAIAFGTVLEDIPPRGLCNVSYSTDGGCRWRPWAGWLRLGSLDPGGCVTVLLRGTVCGGVGRDIVNCAQAYSSTVDLNQQNNQAFATVELGR
ncbi:MAG: DUF11 domain-containing protein [Oscillospiraceae bacterium]|nr:DUF11 domain-containing protein [Oscillospiraceae bacterium]